MILTLALMLAATCAFAQFNEEMRMFTKCYGASCEGRSLWGKVRVVKKGFAHFNVYCARGIYDFPVTMVDKEKPNRDEWRILGPDAKEEEDFSVRFVENRESADFVIRITNPEKIPAWLKYAIIP